MTLSPMESDLKALITVLSLIVVFSPITIFPSEKILQSFRIAHDFSVISFAFISASVSLTPFSIKRRLEFNLAFFKLTSGDMSLIGDVTIVKSD
jgi:hypothetical protein